MKESFRKQLKTLKEFQDEAVRKCDILEESRLSNSIGELLASYGSFQESLEEHMRELQLSNSIGDQLGTAIAYRMVGERQCELQLFEDALKNQKKYHEIVRTIGNLKEEQCALATIGRTYFLYSHSFDGVKSIYYSKLAKEAYSSAWNCCDMLLNTDCDNSLVLDMKARLFVNFANLFEMERNYISAKQFLYKCINISETLSIPTKFSAYFSLGSLYLNLFEYDKAKENFQTALSLCRDDCNIYHETQVLERLGFTYAQLRSFNFAKSCLRKALKFESLSNVDSLELKKNYTVLKSILRILKYFDECTINSNIECCVRISTYEKLGDLTSKIHAFNASIFYYTQQLQLSLQSNSSSNNLADIHVSLAVTFSDMNKISDAIFHYEKELELKKFLTYKEKAKTLEIIGDLYCTQKDKNEIATYYFKEAISLNTELSDLAAAMHISEKIRKIDVKKEINGNEELSYEERYQSLHPLRNTLEVFSDLSHDSSFNEDSFILSDSNCSNDNSLTYIKSQTKILDVNFNPNIEKKNHKGETALHQAVIQGNLQLVKIYLYKAVNVNTRDNCGWTPLHEACNYGYPDITSLLLKSGALVNDQGGYECCGVTPLHDAVQNGNIECIKLLLSFGADVNISDSNGVTPIDLAKEHFSSCNDDKIYTLFSSNQILKSYSSEHSPLRLPTYSKSKTKFEDNLSDLKCNSDELNLEKISKLSNIKLILNSNSKTKYIIKHRSYLSNDSKLNKKDNKDLTHNLMNSQSLIYTNTDNNINSSRVIPWLETKLNSNDTNFLISDPSKVKHSPSFIKNQFDYPIDFETMEYENVNELSFFSNNILNFNTHLIKVSNAKNFEINGQNFFIFGCLPNCRSLTETIENKLYLSLGCQSLIRITEECNRILYIDNINYLNDNIQIYGRIQIWGLQPMCDWILKYICFDSCLSNIKKNFIKSFLSENEFNLIGLPIKFLSRIKFDLYLNCMLLTTLCLNENPLNVSLFYLLNHTFLLFENLTYLDVASCQLSCKTIKTLNTSILKSKIKLNYLNLSYNFICDINSATLCTLLSINSSLKILKLNSIGLNFCDKEDIYQFSTCLNKLLFLKCFYLSNNYISDSLLIYLLTQLNWSQLTLIDISGHNIDLCIFLSRVEISSLSLETLIMRRCVLNFSDNTVITLDRMLQKCSKLIRICISFLYISHDFIQKLELVCQNNNIYLEIE